MGQIVGMGCSVEMKLGLRTQCCLSAHVQMAQIIDTHDNVSSSPDPPI